MRFRLDPDLVTKADLTPKEVEALEIYDGNNYGRRAVARTLDISESAARDRIRSGLRKIEKATRP